MRAAVRAIIVRNNKLLVMHRNKFGEEYDTLIGGGVDMGEDHQTALVREVFEETGLEIEKNRLVFIEEAGMPYGTQYVFLCQDPGGEVALRGDSDEAKISAQGKNIYKPGWVSIKHLKDSTFRSEKLKRAILNGLENGFSEEPVNLKST